MVARVVRIDRGAGPYEQQRGYIFAPDDFLFRQVVAKIEGEQLDAIRTSMESTTLEDTEPSGERGAKEPDVIPIGSSLTGDRSIFLGGPGGYQKPVPMPLTPTEIEAGLRKEIEDHVRKFAFINRYPIKQINAEVKNAFGKPRSEMTLAELKSAMSFIRDAYPLKGKSLVSFVSQPRGKGKRVMTKAVEVNPPEQESFWGCEGV
jgi:hypothetical protein